MNSLFENIVIHSRTAAGLLVMSVLASCTGPQTALEGPEVLDLPAAKQRSLFPKVQNIGVVELSGARLAEKPLKGGLDREFVASGGALLIKKVDKPIQAYGPEITVTPEMAMVSGKGVVRKGDQLFIGESDTSRLFIDGTQVTAEGPYRQQSVDAWKKEQALKAEAIRLAAAPAPVIEPAPAVTAPVVEPVAPEVTEVVQAPEKPKAKKPLIKPATPAVANPATKQIEPPRVDTPPAPAKPKPQTVAAPVKKSPPAVSKPKVTTAPAPVKKAPEPVAKTAPKPESSDRSQLLNLMREPKE